MRFALGFRIVFAGKSVSKAALNDPDTPEVRSSAPTGAGI
jgi:hypothetical protein